MNLAGRAETAITLTAYNGGMNESHLKFLSSPEWAAMLETDLLPWIRAAGELGDDVLEIGPGPGLTTDLLRHRVARLTAVEVDGTLAAALRERLSGTNVDVICTDATESGLDPDRFSAATCFSMLHHMAAPADQDRLFAELNRVLRPGGVFVGTDSRDLDVIRAGHIDDTFVPVDPDTLAGRLATAGFADTELDVGEYQIRFLTRKRGGRTRSATA
jgi:SAM-dependent methyltransferase